MLSYGLNTWIQNEQVTCKEGSHERSLWLVIFKFVIQKLVGLLHAIILCRIFMSFFARQFSYFARDIYKAKKLIIMNVVSAQRNFR